MPQTSPTDAAAACVSPPRNPVHPAWGEHWEAGKRHFRDWWEHRGMVLHVSCPLDEPREGLAVPEAPDLETAWIGPEHRAAMAEALAAAATFLADCVPKGPIHVGAGDLAAMLGCEWEFGESTVWFHPCLDDAAVRSDQPIVFDEANSAYQAIRHMLEAALRRADGRYLIGIPDLVEHFDILAAMRGTQTLLMDLFDDPAWVHRRLTELNDAYFAVYDRLYELLRDDEGAVAFCAFNLWGPGRTAKVQCDACSMLGPDAFREFVQPYLDDQCRRLDYAMYHLDGKECLQHVNALLEIEPLRAIQWTPGATAGGRRGGHPDWHPLYRRILDAGKSVQIHCGPDDVIPLLDKFGPAGLYFMTGTNDRDAAERLIEKAEAYR